MLILYLGDRVCGAFLLTLAVILGCLSHAESLIPGQTIFVVIAAVVAGMAALLGVEFLLGCPTLTRLANRRAGKTNGSPHQR